MPLFSRSPRTVFGRKEDQLSRVYNSIQSQDDYRDLEFICGEDRLRYHQAMVIPHSLFLTKLINLHTCCKGFCSNREEISVTLDGFSASIVEIVIGCLYYREIPRVPSEVLDDVQQLKNVLGIVNLTVEDNFETRNAVIENESNEELKEFACDICSMSFNLSIKLKKHMKIHKNKIIHNNVLEIDVQTQSLSNEKLINTENSFTCPICKEVFNLSIKLKMHMKIHKYLIFPDIKPISNIDTALEDTDEKNSNAQASMADDDKSEISEKMNKIINRFESYVNHENDDNIDTLKSIKTDNTNPIQIVSNDTNPMKTKTSTAKRKRGGGIMCNMCEDTKDYQSRSRLLIHLSQSHYLDALKKKFLSCPPVEQLICQICKAKQTNSTMYMRHIGAIHEAVLEFLSPDMTAAMAGLPAKRNAAKMAPQVAKLEPIVQHSEKDIYIRDNSCSTCGKYFSSKQTLVVHMLSCNS